MGARENAQCVAPESDASEGQTRARLTVDTQRSRHAERSRVNIGSSIGQALRVADTRRQPMRLSALFEEFCHYLRVEKEAAPRTIETYRWCFRDYESFVMKQFGGTVLVTHFTADTCRAYQYDLAARGLQTSSIRVRLATLGSFGKWAVRRDKLVKNPVDVLTRPRRKARLPRVPRWETVEVLLQDCTDPRDKALVALMCYGGLRRSEIVALDVGVSRPAWVSAACKVRGAWKRPSRSPRSRSGSWPTISRQTGRRRQRPTRSLSHTSRSKVGTSPRRG